MTQLRPFRRAPSLALALFLLASGLLAPFTAAAQGPSIIRDAEIENIIRAYATPLFQAAGLNPRTIRVYLIQDDSLNAFVTGGNRMFLHTGLLMRSEDPRELIGVIAHETGHIAGGHLAARVGEIRQASRGLLATYALGLAAALATGRAEFGALGILAGQDVALKNVLSYSRSHEQAADQAAVSLLRATGQSPQGLLDFMRLLSGQEVLLSNNQDPYMRTHPLSIERVSFLQRQVEESPYADLLAPPEFLAMQRRMRAKLIGYLRPIQEVFRTYPKDDQSLEARYAHAIAYYRAADLELALPLVDELIAERPRDPYFHELRGQMLFEHGKVEESLTDLETAARILPEAAQIRMLLGRAQLETNDPALNAAALENLNATLRQEPKNAFAWRLVATAHGRAGDQGMTALALAEAALSQGRYVEARGHAGRAAELLPPGTSQQLQAEDVRNQAEYEAAKTR